LELPREKSRAPQKAKNGDGGGSRLKISKGAVWHRYNFSGTTHLI